MVVANGPFQPPRNRVVDMAHTVIILAYSAMKNMAYFILEYSVQKPDTSSVSASGRSKGVRLISAIEQIKKIMNASGCLNAYQSNPPNPDCSLTISFSERVPVSIKTATIARAAASS